MQRRPDYLYRITLKKDGRWSVTSYLENATDVVGPSAMFTDEALPDWIRKDVALLHLVDPMGEIKGVGHRIGDAYWLVTENSKKLLKKRQVVLAMAADQMDFNFFGENE